MNRDLFFSYQVYRATQKFFSNGGDKKVRFSGSFGLFGYLRATVNMTEQMVGKASVSIYPVGDKVVVLVIDSKSISSWTWKWWDGDEANLPREDGQILPKSTTHQTYLFIVSRNELRENYEKYESWHDTDW